MILSYGNNEQGFSILEALIASAVVAVGFAGILSVATMGTQSLQRAADQDKITMLATMVLEDVTQDRTNILQYNQFDLRTPAASAYVPARTKGQRWQARLQNFCGNIVLGVCLTEATIEIRCQDANAPAPPSACPRVPLASQELAYILTLSIETNRNVSATVTRTVRDYTS